ncbi:hypothetical protein ACIBO1_22345 [Micromonospora sp. NPDC049903]|uniref:hypothetical protein n=1 Tax=Micromonospora sp. NPDC049903 TaxID=3364276 RepID=UPI0037AD5D99
MRLTLIGRPRRTGGRGGRIFTALVATVAMTVAGFAVAPSAAANKVNRVMIKTEELHAGLFSLHMRARLAGVDGFKDLMTSASLVGFRQAHPDATAQQLTGHVVALRSHYDSQLTPGDLQRPAYQFALRMLELTALAPGAVKNSPVMQQMLEATVGSQLANYGDMLDQIKASQFQHSWYLQQYGVQEKVWQSVQALALSDAAFRNAWNAQVGIRYDVDAAADIATLSADPELANWVDLPAIMENQINKDWWTQEGERQAAQLLNRANAQIRGYNEDLHALSEQYPLRNGAAKPSEQVYQATMAKSAGAQQWINHAASAFEILALLVGFANPAAGKVISGVGKGVIQIASAINGYQSTAASKDLGKVLASVTTQALAGNIAGAISALLPLFGGGTNPDPAIRAELVALRQQVAQLHQNMNTRFDRIDQALAGIYIDMLAQFQTVVTLQNATNAQLRQINTQLARITERIDLWGSLLLNVERDNKIKETKELIDEFVGYRTQFGLEMDYVNHYAPVSSALRFDMTDEAKSLLFAAPIGPRGPNRPDAPEDPDAALDLYGPYGSIGYLHDDAVRRGKLSGSVGLPANPEMWLQPATGYQMLLAQNPQHAARVNGQVADAVASGEAIQEAVKAFSAPRKPTSDNPRWMNDFLYDAIMAYRQTAHQMAQRMSTIRTEIAQGGQHDMFGSATQPVPAKEKPIAEPTTVPSCAGTLPALSRPAQVRYTDLPQELWVAQWGKPDSKVTLCHDSDWVNVLTRNMGGWEVTTADLEIKFQVRQRWNGGNQTVREWSKVFPQGVICRTHETLPGGECRFIDQELAKWNSTYRGEFERSATYVDKTEEARKRSRDWFYGQGARYYSTITSELANPNPANPQVQTLHGLNTRLTSQARLMQVYLKLGFATALTQDEVLALNLLGVDRFPADLNGLNMITDSFEQARANYCLDRETPCTLRGTIEGPRANQVRFSCANPARTDPISYCAEWLTYDRTDTMMGRLEVWSEKRDKGEYVEGLPAVDLALRSIETADRIARG